MLFVEKVHRKRIPLKAFLPLLLFIMWLALAPALSAQEVFVPGQSSLITKFPFRLYSGGVMVLKAKLQGVPDSLNFVLDTGSGGISLDSSTCSEFNIVTTPTDTTIKGIGGIRRVHFVFNRTLDLPGLQLTGMNFHINNYEVLTSVYGEKIDGIIGYSFFSRYIVHIDFDSLLIAIYVPGKFRYNDKGYMLKPLFTSLPIIPLQVKDAHRQDQNYYFDTGAGLCFLMSEQFAA
ncbi:MAG: retropepsin-like aspartic protease, partial [Ferruginibacter sp.]